LLLPAYDAGAYALGRSALAAAAQSDAAACARSPDSSALVSKYGAAVVNISATQTLRGEGFDPGFPGLPEDDPFFEFLCPFTGANGRLSHDPVAGIGRQSRS